LKPSTSKALGGLREAQYIEIDNVSPKRRNFEQLANQWANISASM